jgi:hypothetical protein
MLGVTTGGAPPDDPAPKATKRVTVGSVPSRIWNPPITWTRFEVVVLSLLTASDRSLGA